MIEDFLDDYIIYCSRLNEEQLWREYDRLSLHYQTKQISKHDFGIQKGEVISCLRNIYIKQLEYYPKKSIEQFKEDKLKYIKRKKKENCFKRFFFAVQEINDNDILLNSSIFKKYNQCKNDILQLYNDYHDLTLIIKSIYDDYNLIINIDQLNVLILLLQDKIDLEYAEILFFRNEIEKQIKIYDLSIIYNDYDFNCDFDYFKQILDNNFSDNTQYNLF